MKKPNLYKQEIADGLKDLIIAKSISSVLCEIQPSEPFPANLGALPTSLIKAENVNQEDLFYLSTILVSSGWNRNDDVFLPEDIWAARSTPEDKPLNYEHETDDIIGHMTGSLVVNDNKETITEDTSVEDLPKKLHIISSAVLYRFLGTEEPYKRMAKIISEISQNKWFVSMECLMTSFDYAVKDENSGENQIIARNDKTSFLTKYLRAYGGDGVYQGKRIGRVLKDFIFSGKGLVSNPANPESIILSSHAKIFNAVYHNFNEKTFGDNKKMEELQKQIAELQNQLKLKADENTVLQTKVETLEKEKTKVEEEKKVEVETNVAKVKELSDKLAKVEAEKLKAERINVVVDSLAYNKAEAEAWAEDLKSLDEKSFASMVEKMKLKLNQVPKHMPGSQPPGEIGKPVHTVSLSSTVEKIEQAQVVEPTLAVATEVEDDVLKEVANFFGDNK